MRIVFCPTCSATLAPPDEAGTYRCWNCGWTTTSGEGRSQASAASNRSRSPDFQRVQQRVDIARAVRSRWPIATREMVLSKVKQCFPNQDQSEIMALLDTVGYWFDRNKKAMPDVLRAQTQLAALKLAGKSFSLLRDYVEQAKSDYRNVIGPAENPSLLRLGVIAYERLSLTDLQRTLEDEMREYIAWLNNEEIDPQIES